MKKFFSIALGLAVLCIMTLMSSCGDKPKPKSPLTGFEQSLTNNDSVAVVKLIDTFFQYAESGKYEDAAAMLYFSDPDSVYAEPQLLDNEKMKRVVGILSSLPIRSHVIDYIKFKDAYKNEVNCTALIEPAHDNFPEVKTVFYFKPICDMGTWKLCMTDSHSGDHTVVGHNQKDSMKNEYQKEMREKNLQKVKKSAVVD